MKYHHVLLTYHCICLQIISDDKNVIMDVCSRFPGGAHDGFIWSVCGARRMLQQADLEGWLVGTLYKFFLFYVVHYHV
jgi:hypothetical protein